MKKRREHVVPLSRQAVAILAELRGLTGHGRLVFPALGKPDKPLSENTSQARYVGWVSEHRK
jgi:integrase